jgi:hypothetical protein
MAIPTTTPDDLPTLLDTHQVSAALGQDLFTTQRQLRTGVLPGFKLPAGRWRVKRSDIEAILAGQSTPAQRRRELLGDDAKTEAYIDRLVAEAPPLSEAQRDLIATVFRGALTRPTRGVECDNAGNRDRHHRQKAELRAEAVNRTDAH